MSSSDLLIEPFQSQTNRADLMAAFACVVAIIGRCKVTDLHIRRLLSYVCAQAHDGIGILPSLQQIANRLVLIIATCRHVIHRAAKHFRLLTVNHQRSDHGQQSINRYSNWLAVMPMCQPSLAASSLLELTHPPQINSSNNNGSPLRPSSPAAAKSSTSSCNLTPEVCSLNADACAADLSDQAPLPTVETSTAVRAARTVRGFLCK